MRSDETTNDQTGDENKTTRKGRYATGEEPETKSPPSMAGFLRVGLGRYSPRACKLVLCPAVTIHGRLTPWHMSKDAG